MTWRVVSSPRHFRLPLHVNKRATISYIDRQWTTNHTGHSKSSAMIIRLMMIDGIMMELTLNEQYASKSNNSMQLFIFFSPREGYKLNHQVMYENENIRANLKVEIYSNCGR